MNKLVISRYILKYLLFTLAFIVLSNFTGAAQTFSKPQTIEKWLRFGTGLSPIWEHYSTISCTYNAQGKLVDSIETIVANNTNYRRYQFDYDAKGNMISYFNKNWVNGNWEESENYRFTLTYDANNNVVENLKESRIPGDTIWQIYDKTVTIYSNGVISEILYQHFDQTTGLWTTSSRLINLVWHSHNKNLVSFQRQRVHNSAWLNLYKQHTIFLPNNKVVTTYEFWKNNNWEFTSKDTSTTDSFNNIVASKGYSWDNNSWLFSSEESSPFYYNLNGEVIERHYEKIFCLICLVVQPYKYVYSNFQQFNIAGVSNSAPKELNIYPNPTSDFLTLDLPQNQALQVSVSDLTGKTVLKQKFTSTETKQLNLEKLNKGIYLLHLETTEGKTVRKIVKN